MREILTNEDLEKVRTDSLFLEPLISEIVKKENIKNYRMTPFQTGSSIVIDFSDNSILKIYPAFCKKEYESEFTALNILNKNKIENVPALYSFGEIYNEKWFYIIAEKLPGVTLESVWEKISLDQQKQIMYEIGIFLKKIHGIPLDNIHDKEKDWDEFLSFQIKNCFNYHKNLGLEKKFLDQLDPYLNAQFKTKKQDRKIHFLSCDIHYWNILVIQEKDNLKISGFIDFGDASFGEKEYDFLAPSYFMGFQNQPLLHSLFTGYGYSQDELNSAFSHRLFAFHLIHRFSSLKKLSSDIDSLSHFAEMYFRF